MEPSQNYRSSVGRVPALKLPQRILPAVPPFLQDSGRSLDTSAMDETVPHLGPLMAEARASSSKADGKWPRLDTRMPPPPTVLKPPRELDASSHRLDGARDPPPIPKLSQSAQVLPRDTGSVQNAPVLSRSSSRRQLPPPLTPSFPPHGLPAGTGGAFDREAAFKAIAADNSAPMRPTKHSPDQASNFSTTASRPWSKQNSPRQAGPMDMDTQSNFFEQGQAYGVGQSMYRSASMPADIHLMQTGPPMALPMVPGMHYGLQPVASMQHLASAPMALQASIPVALCSECTSSWLPPPLPPVPCELHARLDALENRMGTPQARSSSRLESVAGSSKKQLDTQQADAELSHQLCGELWQAQEAERRTREETERFHRNVVAENQQLKEELHKLQRQQFSRIEAESGLSKDLQELREAKMAEQRNREEVERRHQAALAEHRRLKGDHQKPLEDHAVKRRAPAGATHKHEVMEVEQRFKDDLMRMQLAHEDELHCTSTDWQQKHRDAEEATRNLVRDLQKLKADLEAEQQAREDVERRHQAVLRDAERMRSDFQTAEATVDSEQRVREDVERRHQDVLEELRHSREECHKLSGYLAAEERAHENERLVAQELRHRLQEAEADRNRERESADSLRRRLDVVQGERDMLETRMTVTSEEQKMTDERVNARQMMGATMSHPQDRHSTQTLESSTRGSSAGFDRFDHGRATRSASMVVSPTAFNQVVKEPTAFGQGRNSDPWRPRMTTHEPQRIEVAISSSSSSDEDESGDDEQFVVDLTEELPTVAVNHRSSLSSTSGRTAGYPSTDGDLARYRRASS